MKHFILLMMISFALFSCSKKCGHCTGATANGIRDTFTVCNGNNNDRYEFNSKACADNGGTWVLE